VGLPHLLRPVCLPFVTEDLAKVGELLDAGDVGGAVRLLRFNAERAPLPEVAALLNRAATAAGFDELAAATGAVLADPGSPQALYDTGYECIERGVSAIAVPFLTAALEQAPGQRAIITELVAAYEDGYRYADAVAVLEANQAHLVDWPDRYLLAFNSLMSGDVAKARRYTGALSTPDDDWAHGKRRLDGMLARVDLVPGPLDRQALRGWHFVLNAAILTALSPYGSDEGMNGRYAFIQDSPAGCRHTLHRLGTLLAALDRRPASVALLPDRSSRILGLAAATMLHLPAQPWQPGRGNTVIVAYDLTELDSELLSALRERARDSILIEHASCWTSPSPIAADVTGLLHQSIVEPWGERLMAPPDGQPYRTPVDDRPEEAIAADIVAAEPTDEVPPGDTEADLLSFAAAVARGWPSSQPHRDRMWSPGPVPSSYFT
jgi:hypothetical protein